MIRADANVAIGTGHVMRCLALAQAWQDCGGRSVFAMAEGAPSVERRLRDEGMDVERMATAIGTAEDAEFTGTIGRGNGANWIAVDGYHFGAAYQCAIKKTGLGLLLLDDNGSAQHYCADLVLNQNVHAAYGLYAKREDFTRLLLGPRYALLRREFRQWSGRQREFPAVGRKLLVTMGGSDPDNVTAKVIEAIYALPRPHLETTVIVGGSNPHLQSIRQLLSSRENSIRLVIDATDVSEWIAWADGIVSGAGTTFWEMCFLGLPGMLVVLAENQQGIAASAERLGIAWNLGSGADLKVCDLSEKLWLLLNSQAARKAQSEQGRRLIDGRGAERVASALMVVKLRATLDSDREVFWEWANDPAARAVSFSRRAISWEQHTQWFQGKMLDRNAILHTAVNEAEVPLGGVRYQIDASRAVLSIILAARFRGCGLGLRILQASIDKVFQECDVEIIDAYVKPTNEPSLRLFSGAGFSQLPSTLIDGQEGAHFVLARGSSK